MKRMMIGAALALCTLGAAHAQDKQARTPEDRAKVRTERMTKELGLDADQATKVQAINLKYAQQGKELRAQHQANAANEKGKGAEMRDARMADLKAVLTPEQYQKLEAAQEKMQEKRQEKRKEMHGDKKQ